VYVTMSGVYARLLTASAHVSAHTLMGNALVGCVEQEDRSDNSMRREEGDHADRRDDEQEPAAGTVNDERGGDGPGQVPDLEDTVDEQLGGRVRDADGVEDLVEVVRDETVAGPLREEGDGDDEAHALEVTGCGEERLVLRGA
jgi:hypothetical protein